MRAHFVNGVFLKESKKKKREISPAVANSPADGEEFSYPLHPESTSPSEVWCGLDGHSSPLSLPGHHQAVILKLLNKSHLLQKCGLRKEGIKNSAVQVSFFFFLQEKHLR